MASKPAKKPKIKKGLKAAEKRRAAFERAEQKLTKEEWEAVIYFLSD